MKIRVPSPALVISTIALVVACTATAYAATVIKSSSQIKTGAVNSGDIKNGSVRSVDIKNDTIRTTDLAKSTLRRIDDGGGGGSAIEVTGGVNNQSAAIKNVTVVQMTLPKGAWVIHGKAIQKAVPPASGILVPTVFFALGTCQLDAAGDVDTSTEVVALNSQPASGNHHLQRTRTLGTDGVIKLTCDANLRWSATSASLIAQKVGSVKRIP